MCCGQQSTVFSPLGTIGRPETRPPSDREIRDEQLIADLRTVHQLNFSVYGVNKMHQAMRRRGWQLNGEQTRRLMREAGLRGVQRGKPA